MVPNISKLSNTFAGAQVFVRPSRRSISGHVAVLLFSSGQKAQRCARLLSTVLPALCGGCVVKRRGASWAVSLPVVVS